MRYLVSVPRGTYFSTFTLLPYGDFQHVSVDGVVVFQISKFHNHFYAFDAFFYSSKRIYSGRRYGSKKELYGAIQNLLQQELSVDVQ